MATPRLIMKLRVADIRPEPGDVRVFTFLHPGKPVLPPFKAGAHVDLHLPDGKIRQYSLLGDEQDRTRYRIGVKLEPGGRGGSEWLHRNLRIGSELPVSAPRSHFALAEGDRHLLLAGGIGITPIIAMARSLQASGKAFQLHYFSRSRAGTPLREEIERDFDRGSVFFHFDDEPATRADLTILLAARRGDEQLYYCGPPGFMAAVGKAGSHWPGDAVHFEAFNPAMDDGFVPEPFLIEIRSSGVLLPVAADMSALSVLRAAGISLSSSCENGVCGTCECGFLTGSPIHRDSVLKAEARGHRFIPCVSRAKGTLKLDL